MKLTTGSYTVELDPFAAEQNTNLREKMQPGTYMRTRISWDVPTPTSENGNNALRRPLSYTVIRVNEASSQVGRQLLRFLNPVYPVQQLDLLAHRMQTTFLDRNLRLPGGVDIGQSYDASVFAIPVEGGVAFAVENNFSSSVDVDTLRPTHSSQSLRRVMIGEVVEIGGAQAYFDQIDAHRKAAYEAQRRLGEEQTILSSSEDGSYCYRDGFGDIYVVEADKTVWCSYSRGSGLNYMGPDDSVGFYME